MKKALSLALAVILCLSLLPLGALAEEGAEAAPAEKVEVIAEEAAPTEEEAAPAEEPATEPEVEAVTQVKVPAAEEHAEAEEPAEVEEPADGSDPKEPYSVDEISDAAEDVLQSAEEDPLDEDETEMHMDGSGTVESRLAAVLAEYPNGTKWTGTFDGASTCYGFAGMVIYKVFGKSTVSGKTYRWWTYAGESTSGMVRVGQVSTCTESNVKELMNKARPGDVLQFNAGSNGHQHSMIVYGISSTSVQVYECNWTANTVTLTALTFAQLAARQTRSDGTKRGELSLMTSDNWEAVNGGPYNATVATLSISGAQYPSGKLTKGSSFGLRGIISSGTTISNVSAKVYNAVGAAVLSYSKNPNSTSYNIQTGGLNDAFTFGSLSEGSYRYEVKATDGKETKTLINSEFYIDKPTAFTMSFNANGGSGSMSNITATYGNTFTIPACGFTYNGYSFQGWNVKRNGDDKWYVSGQGWLSESDISSSNYSKAVYSVGRTPTFNSSWTSGYTSISKYTFYAVWTKNALTIKYNANGGVITSDTYSANTSGAILKGSTEFSSKWEYGYNAANGPVNASTFGLYRSGYAFAGWSLSKDGSTGIIDQDAATTPEAIYPNLKNGSATVTLYAIWRGISYSEVPDGIYTLMPECAPDMRLAVADQSYSSGDNVQIEAAQNYPAQYFKVESIGSGYYTITVCSSGLALDVEDGGIASNSNVQQYEPNGTAAQRWMFVDTGEGYYTIIAGENSDLALDVVGKGNTAGTNVQIYKNNGSTAQRWKLMPATAYTTYFDYESDTLLETQVYNLGDSWIVSSNIPTKEGYRFVGWHVFDRSRTDGTFIEDVNHGDSVDYLPGDRVDGTDEYYAYAFIAVWEKDIETPTGWQTVGGKTYYYENGEPLKGWQDIDGNRYFFRSNGTMATDLFKVSGKYYYFGDDGVMRTGQVEIDGAYYYFGASGQRLSGRFQVDGAWYWFDMETYARVSSQWIENGSVTYYAQKDGTLASGKTKISGKYYYFNENTSAMAVSKWIEDGDDMYYFRNNGRMAVGQLKISNKWYYFYEDATQENYGVMAKMQWFEWDDGWHYYQYNGRMVVNQLKKISNKWYWFDANGVRAESEWKTVDGATYYFQDNGRAATGTVTIDGTEYEFDSTGKLIS